MKGSNYRDHDDRRKNRGRPGNADHAQQGDEVKNDDSHLDRPENVSKENLNAPGTYQEGIDDKKQGT